MSTERKSIISAKTNRQMEATLKDVLESVANGSLSVEKAHGGILYLIASIDNGEPSEIDAWTRNSAPYKA